MEDTGFEKVRKCQNIFLQWRVFALLIHSRNTICVGRQPIKQQFQRIETGNNNTLVLRNVQRQHEGNYTCIVRNSLGSDQIVYQLYVHVPPGPPELHVSAASATTVTLEWAVERKYLVFHLRA